VRIDGKVVLELGTIVAPDAVVEVAGKRVRPAREHTYVMMHKPVSVMTTMRDPEGRRTIVELLPKTLPRVVPVGRLDYDTSGLLLLTDDGDLAHRLLHPRYGVEKTYRATIVGELTPDAIRSLREGVQTPEFHSSRAHVKIVARQSKPLSRHKFVTVVEVTIHEGRNRQVRKMFEALGRPVLALARLRFGPLELGSLSVGGVRPLTSHEIAALRGSAASGGAGASTTGMGASAKNSAEEAGVGKAASKTPPAEANIHGGGRTNSRSDRSRVPR
jgi:23S rRNA pseudouridine2605 synthase